MEISVNLVNFLKFCDSENIHNFIFSSENQRNSTVDYHLEFDKIIIQPERNRIILKNSIGFIYFTNTYKVKIKRLDYEIGLSMIFYCNSPLETNKYVIFAK